MNVADKEFFLMRILAGKLKFKDGIYIKPPSLSLLYEASEIYKDYYTRALVEGIMDEAGSYDYLVELDVWNAAREDELNRILPGHIEIWKEDLYKSAVNHNAGRGETVRKGLAIANTEYNRLNNIRHTYDHVTCAGIANYAKLQFLIQYCTYKGKKKYDWNNVSLYTLMSYYQENIIKENDLREISHNQPWYSIWAIGNKTGGVFGRPSIKLSLDQQRLAMWSMMYDNVRESPNAPSDDIINDNDMLDGWFSLERKKRNSETIDTSKYGNVDEIYLPVGEPEQTLKDPQKYVVAATKIDNLNSNYNKSIKKQRFKAIERSGGVLSEQNLPDVKQDIMMQINRSKKDG